MLFGTFLTSHPRVTFFSFLITDLKPNSGSTTKCLEKSVFFLMSNLAVKPNFSLSKALKTLSQNVIQVSLAIRGGYVPEKSQTVNNQTDILGPS